ncbi:hypothetical protein Hanom_Chr11g00994861 [Helianthus anomalus]
MLSKLLTRVTPSSADHSSSSGFDMHSAKLLLDAPTPLSGNLSSSGSTHGTISLDSVTVPECARTGTGSVPSGGTILVSGSFVSSLGEASVGFESRNKQTAAQSSFFDVGYLNRQARVAQSTRARAAVARLGAAATMSTASLFERTSHTCCEITKLLKICILGLEKKK